MVDKSKNNKILGINSIKSLINKNQNDNLSKKEYNYLIKKQRLKSNYKKNNNEKLPPEIENVLVELSMCSRAPRPLSLVLSLCPDSSLRLPYWSFLPENASYPSLSPSAPAL